MKQLFIAIILLLAVGETHAQKWFTPASKWYYGRMNMVGTNSAFEIKVLKDTIIESKNCVILTSRIKDPFTQQWSIVSTYGDFILHDDTLTHIQYVFSKGSFHELYNFNKSIGDTLFIPGLWGPPFSPIDSGAWSRIDSVGVDTIMGIPFKTMFYKEIRKVDGTAYDWRFNGKVIEGIGNIFTPYPWFQGVSDFENPSSLRCFENETISLKLTDLPCDTSINYVSVKEIFDDKSVTIFPNPFNNYLELDFSKLNQTPYKIILVNSLGQIKHEFTIQDLKQKIKLETTNLSDGFYYCQIFVGDIVSTYKLIKQ